jgi:hypothetical protein
MWALYSLSTKTRLAHKIREQSVVNVIAEFSSPRFADFILHNINNAVFKNRLTPRYKNLVKVL